MLYCHLSEQMTLPFRISSKLLFYLLTALLLLLSIVTVVGDRGAIHLWRLRGEKVLLDEQNYRLQKENDALQQRVSRIRHDDHFLEKLAREELNMVRPGEVVYRFSARRSDKAERDRLNETSSESRPLEARREQRPNPR